MTRVQRIAATGCALVCAMLTPVAMLAAQSITGSVQGGGHAVVGAAVRLLELDRIEYTGARGQFTFADVPAGTYTVFVRATGFASTTSAVRLSGASATVTVQLKESAVPLTEIVVSASPGARTTDDQYQSTASKSRMDLANSTGTSFAEKLSDLPGVTVRSLGSAPSRPILRGMGDNEVLILENGLRMGDIATYDPAHATPLQAMSISQIDVVRGPATILYGPNTIGGLVNVGTNIVPAVADHAASGTVAIEGNSVSDEHAGYFNHVISDGNWALRLSAGELHTNDIRIPTGTYTDPGSEGVFSLTRMPQSFTHSGEAGVGAAYQGAFGMVGIGAKTYEMNYGITGDPPNADWMDVPPTTSRIDQRRTTVEFRSLFTGGDAFLRQVRLTANYNDYNHSEFPTAQDASGVSDPEANHFHKRAFNAVLQSTHEPLGELRGTVGLWTNLENLTIEGDQPLGPNSMTTGIAGYAYEEYAASADTRLQFGLRYDYNRIQTNPFPGSSDSVFRTLDASRNSNAFTASFGAIQRLTPEVTGSVNFARSFRAPTVQELFANGLDAASGTYSIGTASLSPENGMGVDASLRGNFGDVAFEVSPYVNYVSNYIYAFLRGDTIQDFPVRKFAATTARLAGFEAGVTLRPARYVAVRANSDYVNAQDTRQGVPLPFTPPLRGLLRGTYQDETYMGMVEWRGAASQTRLGDGDTPTAGYGLLNLGFGLRFAQDGLVHNISVHCDNVFNQVYRDNLSVVKDFIPQPGRGFRLNYELAY